jgi:integrase
VARMRRSWGALRKLPSGRYQARYLDPETRLMASAPETFASKTAADRWLAKKRTELDAGTAVDDNASQLPVCHWWVGYKRSIQARKARTVKAYEAAWRLRIEPRFGDVPVRKVRSGAIDDWVSEMLHSGVSTSKVVEAIGVLKRILDRAVRDKALPTNPCAARSVTLPRRAETERPVLSPAEVESLAAAMRHERDRVLVRVLAYCGLRIGEAFALRWSDVDLKAGLLHIRQSVEDTTGVVIVGPTKTWASRSVTPPAALVSQLRALCGTGLVFANNKGEHLRYTNWRRDVWDPAVTLSGVVALPHDLRATCASLLIDAGASPKDVQAHLGHENAETTLRLYARVRPGRSADIAAKLDVLISEAV